MQCKSQALYGQMLAAVAFFDPELLSIGKAMIYRWMKEEPRLTFLDHYISDLFRKQAHVRSAEVEELLGMLADPFAGTSVAARMLTNADFKFKPAISCDGHKIPVAQGTLSRIYTSADLEYIQAPIVRPGRRPGKVIVIHILLIKIHFLRTSPLPSSKMFIRCVLVIMLVIINLHLMPRFLSTTSR
jgi:hypothetical protein